MFQYPACSSCSVYGTAVFIILWVIVGIATVFALIGIWERINIGILLLWIIMLAIVLLKADRKSRLAKEPAR